MIKKYLSEIIFKRKYIPQEYPFHEEPYEHSQYLYWLFHFPGQSQDGEPRKGLNSSVVLFKLYKQLQLIATYIRKYNNEKVYTFISLV